MNDDTVPNPAALAERLIERCPRCCTPGSPADFLTAQQREHTFRCDQENPCGWRKFEGQTIENHDELVMMFDGLQRTVSSMEAMIYGATGADPPGDWNTRITQPTKPANVHEDCVRIADEIEYRLGHISVVVVSALRGKRKPVRIPPRRFDRVPGGRGGHACQA